MIQNKGLVLFENKICFDASFCFVQVSENFFSISKENLWQYLVLTGLNGVVVQFRLRQLPRFYTPLNDKIYLASSFNQWRPNDKEFEFDRTTNSLIVDLKDTTNLEFKITRGSWSTTETWADGTERANRKITLVIINRMMYFSYTLFPFMGISNYIGLTDN